MKILRALFFILASAICSAATFDIRIDQQSPSTTPTWPPVIVSPSANSLLGFDGTKKISDVVIGSGLSLSGGTLSASGGGNVVGPASATDGDFALFDTTTGKLIKDGGAVGGAAHLSVGTTTGTVAAGDDSRIVAGGTALQPGGNGSGLTGITASQVGAAPAFTSGTANSFWATPNGSTGVPTLRAIVAADIPALAYSPVAGSASLTTFSGGTFGSAAAHAAGDFDAAGSVTRASLGIATTDSPSFAGVTASTGNITVTATGNGVSLPGGGSVTGVTAGAVTVAASGTNQNVTITPSGTGYTVLNGHVGIGATSTTRQLVVSNADTAGNEQIIAINTSNNPSASAQITCENNNPNDMYFGIINTNAAVNGGAFDANFGYFATSPGTSGMGIAARSSTGVIRFYTGGSAAANQRMTIDKNGVIAMKATTVSTSSTTGALTVAGGEGIAGDFYVGGILNVAAKTPASATDTGVAGTICADANFIYVCTATNVWKRAAISTW